MKGKIAITTSSFGEIERAPIEKLVDNGYEVIMNPFKRTLIPGELINLAQDAVGIIAGTEMISGETLNKLPILKVISRCGVGVNNVDLEAAEKMGIKVCNTPDAPTDAVAELTVGLMIACLRGITSCDRGIRKGDWRKITGELLKSKTVGIFGYGRIGRSVSLLVRAFGAKVIFCDIAKISEEVDIEQVAFNDLIERADIVSLHMPFNKSNQHLISANIMKKMKPGAYLINTARGELVDEKALYENLKSGHLSGAALDTYETEPYQGVLKELDNVVLTSHIGSYAKESRINMERQAVENLLKYLEVQS